MYSLWQAMKKSEKNWKLVQLLRIVDSLEEAKYFLQQNGAVLLTEPNQTPGSRIMFVKHPDGSVAEYVQPLPH
jgi:hypothetical protein